VPLNITLRSQNLANLLSLFAYSCVCVCVSTCLSNLISFKKFCARGHEVNFIKESELEHFCNLKSP